jgi:hypothetical protein
MPPTPSIPLLSAQQAKQKLREIVEGFFFRRRNDQGQAPARHLLVRSPPGLGKTRGAMRKIGSAPQIRAPKSGRNPGEFQTVV